jgi:hypothetical protein
MSGFVVAVDYGTVNTVAVLRWPDGQVRPLLVDGSPLVSSAAAVGPDGRLLVGWAAESAGRIDPTAFAADPRTRIDAGTVVLGRLIFPVVDVIAATLALVAEEATRSAGGPPSRLVLTHPATWNETRRATLAEAGLRTGLGQPVLVPAAVAAAWHHSDSAGDLEPGRCLLVYDLGAETFEASLVRRSADGYELLAANGLEDAGGVDLDGLLINIIGAAVPSSAAQTWQSLTMPTTTAGLRQYAQWCDDVRMAKESLSRQLEVTVHAPLVDSDVRIGREAFESAAEPLLARTVVIAADLLTSTGTPLDRVEAVLLLGGSSRIPLITTLLRDRFGRPPTAFAQPELAVAEGALTAAHRTHGEPAAAIPPRTAPADPPAPEPTSPIEPAAVAAAGAGVGSRRPRILALAAALVCVLLLAGWYTARGASTAVPGDGQPRADTRTTATSGGGVLVGAPTIAATSAAPTRSPSARRTPTASPGAPTSSAVPTGTPAVSVSVTATPTSGTCTTDITFVAHFIVNDPGKYHWRWVFGGPPSYPPSGFHDRDKTGDEHITKKFDKFGSGTFWAQVQITSPVTVYSNRASVQITCSP